MTDLDARRVNNALVAMLFDPQWAAAVRGDAPVPELSARERALLRTVDPRALRADPFRRARAVRALVEEFGVAAAIVGAKAIDPFFASPAFRAAVLQRGSMALSFGAWLGDRAGGVGPLETAAATVRRAIDPRQPGWCCAATLRAAIVPAGTLAFWLRGRAWLGDDPVRTLAERGDRFRERPPVSGAEFLLVERRADGSIDVGTASEPLVRLLLAAESPRSRADLAAQAIRCGADPAEADELLDDLRAQGLLREIA